jgi:uncharacterized protein
VGFFGARFLFFGTIAPSFTSSYPSTVAKNKIGPLSPAQKLCLECGLCCNGVIFADVCLQKEDDPKELKMLGLPLTGSPWQSKRFSQPCAALEGCRCRIYPLRPTYCRKFTCLLLKRLEAGEISNLEAKKIVKTAREKSAAVLALIRQLGDQSEQRALTERVRRTAERLGNARPDEPTAAAYARLTLAFHELTVMLGDSFYRPPAD